MDSESDKQKNTEGEKSEDGDPLSNDRNVFQSFWVRYSYEDVVRLNRFLLDYNRYFLPSCGIVLWSIFLLLKS